jgi:hypothetical protein
MNTNEPKIKRNPGRPKKIQPPIDYKQMLHDAELSTGLELYDESDYINPRSMSQEQAEFCSLYVNLGLDAEFSFRKAFESKCVGKTDSWIRKSAKTLLQKMSIKHYIETLQRTEVLRQLQSSPELGIALNGRACQELIAMNSMQILLDPNADAKTKMLASQQLGNCKHVDAFQRSTGNTMTNNFVHGAFQVDTNTDSNSAKAKLMDSLKKTLESRQESNQNLLSSGCIDIEAIE